MCINPLIKCWDGSHKSGCAQNSQMNNCKEQESHLSPTGLWTVPVVTALSLDAAFHFCNLKKLMVINQLNLLSGGRNSCFGAWRSQLECPNIKQLSAQDKKTDLRTPLPEDYSGFFIQFLFFVSQLQEKCNYKFCCCLSWRCVLQETTGNQVGFIPPANADMTVDGDGRRSCCF